nr:MAG TPA: hypothetical protein [Caudoviricetes sp.]
MMKMMAPVGMAKGSPVCTAQQFPTCFVGIKILSPAGPKPSPPPDKSSSHASEARIAASDRFYWLIR